MFSVHLFSVFFPSPVLSSFPPILQRFCPIFLYTTSFHGAAKTARRQRTILPNQPTTVGMVISQPFFPTLLAGSAILPVVSFSLNVAFKLFLQPLSSVGHGG